MIIKEVQTEAFLDEMECIKLNKRLSKESKITNLDPFIDDHGLLRVGGRLRNARLPADERHPVIIPGKHHISLLLVRHFHKQTKHQGRHFTSGAVRSAGYWIKGEKRLVSSVLQKCVVCRKLRGNNQNRKWQIYPKIASFQDHHLPMLALILLGLGPLKQEKHVVGQLTQNAGPFSLLA